MSEQEIRAAVEVIVADVLYFNGEAPLTVAGRTQPITAMVVKESEGYQQLRDALASTEPEEAVNPIVEIPKLDLEPAEPEEAE